QVWGVQGRQPFAKETGTSFRSPQDGLCGSAGRERKAARGVRVGQRVGETNPGRKRRRNEDAYVCDPPLFAVADGMGGAQAGEVASSLAAEAAKAGNTPDAEEGGAERVAELTQEANRRVHQRAVDD